MKNQRILFATDVPFWQKSTGAEQRIFSLQRYLSGNGFCCAVFYLGNLEENDRDLIDTYDLEIFQNSSEQPPEKLLNRIRWYADATIHQARNWLTDDAEHSHRPDGPKSLVIDDYIWPWAQTRFAEVVESFEPDAIIIEYITMAYFLDALTERQRNNTVCLINTHDVLHRRAAQFFAHGFPHWLDIDREQETQVLKKFDAVIAIQDQEAATFRDMVGEAARVITVGHAVERGGDDLFETDHSLPSPKKISVGYIGSKNFSNWQAIREFLNCAWPTVMMKNDATCELVIAGAICDWFDTDDDGQVRLGCTENGGRSETGIATQSAIANMRLLGRIDRVEDFYDAIDLVINPVEFGTGLKIKNAESLQFGKLLITTLNGFNGMPEATRLACMVVESVNEMGLAINSICSDLSQIRPMQQLALQLAQTEFSESQAYTELKQYLIS